jgi:hypothetical protein
MLGWRAQRRPPTISCSKVLLVTIERLRAGEVGNHDQNGSFTEAHGLDGRKNATRGKPGGAVPRGGARQYATNMTAKEANGALCVAHRETRV